MLLNTWNGSAGWGYIAIFFVMSSLLNVFLLFVIQKNKSFKERLDNIKRPYVVGVILRIGVVWAVVNWFLMNMRSIYFVWGMVITYLVVVIIGAIYFVFFSNEEYYKDNLYPRTYYRQDGWYVITPHGSICLYNKKPELNTDSTDWKKNGLINVVGLTSFGSKQTMPNWKESRVYLDSKSEVWE